MHIIVDRVPERRTIPATLQDSLMARLDRLGTGKSVAQMAAVLGREFDEVLLRAMGDLLVADLTPGLNEYYD